MSGDCGNNKKDTEATIKIPFDSPRYAEIAYRVLNVDQEPRRNFVEKELRLRNDCLEIHFKADQVKNIRTAITSFFESFLLCEESIKTFDTDALENAGAHTSTNAT